MNRRKTFDAEALYCALRLLSAEESCARAREQAVRVLLSQLCFLSSRTRIAQGSGAWSGGDLDETVEDAIQHVAIVASTGSSRFRGGHPSEAVAWCQRILANFVASEGRRRARNVALVPRERASAELELKSELEGTLWRHAGQEAALLLLQLDGSIKNTGSRSGAG